MFVIVYDNSVILGPMIWNRFRFENEIQEECDVSVTLPNRNDESQPIIVSENIKILPVQSEPIPNYNSKIQFLNGPYWVFTNEVATQSFVAQDMSVDAVKSNLKNDTASVRWTKENAGVNVTIGSTEYLFKTDKENRSLLQNAALNLNGINWKQNSDTWIELSKEDTQYVLNEVLNYVESCFQWEYNKVQEIDSCQTLEQLNNIVIEE